VLTYQSFKEKRMDDTQTLAYVSATSTALGFAPDAARDSRVAMHLGRTLGMVKLLDSIPLAAHDELAEIYQPAPFPSSDIEDSL
jgi:hypothetical protein